MKKKALVSGITCWLLFGIFTVSVNQDLGWIDQLDRFGYQLTQPTYHLKTQIMIILTHFGDPIIIQLLTILLALYLWWQDRHSESLWDILLQFVGYSLVILVKYSILRPRPSNKLFPASGYSFPSGHTFATVIFVLTLITVVLPYLHSSWLKLLIGLLAAFWIITIMVTRVYLRDHYTSDVIGGFLLAAGWWLITRACRQPLLQWLIKPITKINN